MIYKTSYLKKEMKQAYSESRNSLRQMLFIAFLLGLAAVVMHTILLSMQDSVITDTWPFLVDDSFYAILFMYTAISYIYFIFYFIRNFHFVTFAEIKQNRWYMLCKMGFSSALMIIAKLFASLYLVFVVYSFGYVVAILLAGIYGYGLMLQPLLTLYLSGLLNAISFTCVVMVLSLWFMRRRDAAAPILLSAALFALARHFTDHSHIVVNESAMQNVHVLENSLMMWVEVLLSLTCILICILSAMRRSQSYTLNSTFGFELEKDFKTNRVHKKGKRNNAFQRVMTSILVVLVLILIVAGCLLNLTLMLMTRQGSGVGEFSIQGYIPYLMQTDTMTGWLENNDLTVFRVPKLGQEYKKDEIVLFDAGAQTATIEKIEMTGKTACVVDVVKYPVGVEEGMLRFELPYDQIRGVLVWRSRLLGALVLFATSTIGRILMLVVPMIVLFFYDNIAKASSDLEKRSGRVKE